MGKQITLGLITSQIDSGYSHMLLSGLSDWIRAHGENLIVFTGRGLRSPYGHEYQSNIIFEYIKPGTVDALVIATGTQCNYITSAEFHSYMSRFGGVPAVSMGIRIDGVPSVIVDNKTGIFEAVEHLFVVHGYKRIAFLAGPQDNDEAQERYLAYHAAIRARGLDEDPALVIPCDFSARGVRFALGQRFAGKRKLDFQAIIAANDDMAIAAVKMLTELGFAVPRDVAVVGFDNIEPAQFIIPPLTTIAQPLVEQARTAADFATRLLHGEPVPETVVLPTRLIKRTSCGCLPRAVMDLDGLAALSNSHEKAGYLPEKNEIVERCLIRLAEQEFTHPDRAIKDLLEALIELVVTTDGFIGFLHSALSDEILRKVDISTWQTLLTVLHQELASTARSAEELGTIGISFQKARALLAEMLRMEQGKGKTDIVAQLLSLRSIMERLISAASGEELMKDLTEDLDRLDVRTCFIAGYSPEINHRHGAEWNIPNRAEIMLAYVDGKRVELDDAHRSFSPAKHFVPPELLPKDRQHILVAQSLYFRDDQIGYIVFEPGERDNAIYETFCVMLSNILKGSLLFQARQKAEERLRQVLVELEEYNQRLSGLSQTDELTSLLNRRGFLSLGRQNLTLARRMGRRGNVFFADLDELKKINDTYGHQEGDAALRAAADMLKKTFRTMDVISRLGGDEFAVLTVDTVPDVVESLRHRLQACISTYNADSGKPYKLSMSIGAVPFEKESTVSLEELLDRADDVLYAEKKRKKAGL
jgi:diguanylate cyclase (GGDEF)-like protein